MKWQTLLTLLHIERPGTRGMFVSEKHCVEAASRLTIFFFLIFTASLKDGLRSSETTIEDIFIRKFMNGTFHSLVCSEVIIKRQHNHIRIAALLRQGITARKMYFLIGYTEELLASWLQCPVTLELQTIADRKEVIFKYI